MKFIKYSVKVFEDGSKIWRNKEGKLHREDGPAVEYTNGRTEYWINGKLHREDGPALERANGYKEYYLDGRRYSEKEFLAKTSVKETVSCAGKIIEFEGKKYRLEEV